MLCRPVTKTGPLRQLHVDHIVSIRYNGLVGTSPPVPTMAASSQASSASPRPLMACTTLASALPCDPDLNLHTVSIRPATGLHMAYIGLWIGVVPGGNHAADHHGPHHLDRPSSPDGRSDSGAKAHALCYQAATQLR